MTTLYHYCPTASFHSIVQTRTIWLSSLSQSNDYMEGRLVDLAITRLSEADKLDASVVTQIQASVELIREIIDGLGFCLSEKSDLLSQWRGYANDATGIAIGFSKDYLQLLKDSLDKNKSGFGVEKVGYDLQAHDEHVKPTYLKVKELIELGAFQKRTSLLANLLRERTAEEIKQENEHTNSVNSKAHLEILSLFSKLFLLKSSAFIEEHEWRLVSYLLKDGEDSCSYRSINNQVVPYRAFELLKLVHNPIDEVILGPKHQTPVKVVHNFLKQNGFEEVKVIKSKATYR